MVLKSTVRIWLEYSSDAMQIVCSEGYSPTLLCSLVLDDRWWMTDSQQMNQDIDFRNAIIINFWRQSWRMQILTLRMTLGRTTRSHSSVASRPAAERRDREEVRNTGWNNEKTSTLASLGSWIWQRRRGGQSGAEWISSSFRRWWHTKYSIGSNTYRWHLVAWLASSIPCSHTSKFNIPEASLSKLSALHNNRSVGDVRHSPWFNRFVMEWTDTCICSI